MIIEGRLSVNKDAVLFLVSFKLTAHDIKTEGK